MHVFRLTRRIARRVTVLFGARSTGNILRARMPGMAGLAGLLLAAIVAPASAQTATPTWTLEAEHAERPRSVEGVFESQEAAEAALWEIQGPSDAGGAFQYVKPQKLLPVDGMNTTIVFTLGAEQPLDPEWTYSFLGSQYVTEASMLEAMETWFGNYHEASCGAMSIEPKDEWTATSPDVEGRQEERNYQANMQVKLSDGSCAPYVSAGYSMRTRRLQCPILYTEWNDEYQACVRPDVAAYLTGPVQPDECSTGNPCDVQTGAKSQPEEDFDLGWARFVRTFRSSQVARRSNFGPGWSHSHEVRLSVAGDHALLNEGSGLQRPFRRVGNAYEAADASGDRIVAEAGGGWTLFAADRTLAFDAQGRIARTTHEDGSFLDYAYDAADRLQSVTHSTGRELNFLYHGSTRHAPMNAIELDGLQLASYGYSAEVEDQLVHVRLADNRYRHYHYEDERYPYFLTGVTDEHGNRYSWFEYDDSRRVVASYHEGGADGVTLAYGSSQTVVTDALGAQTTYDLTPPAAGLPKVGTVTDAAGTLIREYNDAATDFRRRLARSVDREGVETLHTYVSMVDDGVPVRVHTIREAAGLPQERTVVVRTASDSNRVHSVEQDGRRVEVLRNAQLQPVSIAVTDTATSETRETTITYCTQADVDFGGYCPFVGYVKSVDGPRTDVGDVTSYVYYFADHPYCATMPTFCLYRKGDLRQVINAQGRIVTEVLAYDGAGRPLSVRDINRVITDYEYHPRGWLTAQKVRGTDSGSEADDRITTIDYLPTGLVSSVTLPDGSFTSYVYDAAHRLTDIVDADGNRLHYTLDNAGNRIKEEVLGENDALKRTLSRVYNQLGQLATQADAGANPTDFTYDANGNLETATDALDRVTQNGYDPLNRLIATLQDVGGIEAATAFEYDALDNLTKVTDPKGLDTVYTYNGFGDLTQLDSPDTGVTTYTYDAAGNRTSQTDARGETTTYGYDALNRLTSVSYSDSSLNVSYGYDTSEMGCMSGETFASGRLTRMADSSGYTHYCYDRFGQLVRKWQVTNGQLFNLRYEYTKAGQLSRMTYPDGTEVDYVRDGQGRTSEIGVTAPGGSREVLLSNASWYPFGPVGAWTFGNGRTLSRTLDLDYRPQSILSTGTGSATSGGGLDLGFGFDPVGNLSSLHGADRAEPPRVRLDYDALSRLTAFRDGPTDTTIESYGYDATGNRTSFTDAGGLQSYSYPADSHRLGAINGVARGYDAVGNTIAVGTAKEYVYNAANRLSAVKQGGAVTMNYGYNGRGERVHRHLGSDVTYSVYDEAGHWIGDYDASGAPKQQAIWLDDLPVGLLDGIATTANRLHYIEPDHLGTPRAVIEPQRDVAVWTWDIASEAFGNSAPNEDPDGDSTAFVLDMRFPGQRYDAASGLNYNYFRDYEARTGRYSQSDPIGLLGGVTTFSYALGNPAKYVDPLGLEVVGTYNKDTGIITITNLDDGKTLTAPAFSGMPGQYQPAPNGSYVLSDFPWGSAGQDHYFALLLDDGRLDDYADGHPSNYDPSKTMAHIRLHSGYVSHACVTVPSEADSNPWLPIQQMIQATTQGPSINIGGQSFPNYGRIEVIGSGFGSVP